MTDVVISKTDKPNSYEFGPTGSRFKIYFDEVSELLKKMAELRDANLVL